MKDFFHHLFSPRESNNHRAKVLHHDSLLFVICSLLFCASLLTFVHKSYPQVLGISTNISAQDLLNITNQKREEHGLTPLVLNTQLTHAAEQKAQNMLANNYWAHVAPDGTTPWYFIKNAGYEYLYAGENLARGFTTARAVVDAWMASPTHRENMLSSNYKDVGFAIQTGRLTGSETILVVEELGSKYNDQEDVAPASIGSPSAPASIFPSVAPEEQAHEPTTAPPVVASVNNEPLIDRASLTKQIALGVLIFLLIILIIDAIVIERKKITRVTGHNVDHILFLSLVIIIAIIIGRGVVQ
jgi:hypothetical protein